MQSFYKSKKNNIRNKIMKNGKGKKSCSKIKKWNMLVSNLGLVGSKLVLPPLRHRTSLVTTIQIMVHGRKREA